MAWRGEDDGKDEEQDLPEGPVVALEEWLDVETE